MHQLGFTSIWNRELVYEVPHQQELHSSLENMYNHSLITHDNNTGWDCTGNSKYQKRQFIRYLNNHRSAFTSDSTPRTLVFP